MMINASASTLDIEDRTEKTAALNALVYSLPDPNRELMDSLSRFLIQIVNNSDVNKMTIRNGTFRVARLQQVLFLLAY